MLGNCDDCRGPKVLTHTSKSYRSALVIVVALNFGMGVVEGGGASWVGREH